MVPIDTWPPTQSQSTGGGPRFQDLEMEREGGRGGGGDATMGEEEKDEGLDLTSGFAGGGSAGEEYLMQLLWPG